MSNGHPHLSTKIRSNNMQDISFLDEHGLAVLPLKPQTEVRDAADSPKRCADNSHYSELNNEWPNSTANPKCILEHWCAAAIDPSAIKHLFHLRAGLLYWKNQSPGRENNTEAGHAGFIDHRGECWIDIDGVVYNDQRLIWAWHNGDWPENQTDHNEWHEYSILLTDAELALWADQNRPKYIQAKRYRYYDAIRNWGKIESHLNDSKIRSVLTADFSKYLHDRMNVAMDPSKFPGDYEDWPWLLARQDGSPAFWKLVKHGACHWLVNTNLLLAQRVAPNRNWRILHSDAHSTVWDGVSTFFDLNFKALRIAPSQTWKLASAGGKTMEPGKMIDTDDWEAELDDYADIHGEMSNGWLGRPAP
jgi:hypothetical protein